MSQATVLSEPTFINHEQDTRDNRNANLAKLGLIAAGAPVAVALTEVPAHAQAADPVAEVNTLIGGFATIVAAGLSLGITIYGVVYAFRIMKKAMS